MTQHHQLLHIESYWEDTTCICSQLNYSHVSHISNVPIPRIPDPDAVKPDDWDEDAPPKISDPDAVKPEGWLDDGPEFIPDTSLEMPEDWDEEEDGEWEPPMIGGYGVWGMGMRDLGACMT